MKAQDRYLMFVHWSEEDQLYVGYCPDLFPAGGVCHANNCALNAVLLELALGFDRQLQMLGLVPEGGTCTSIQNQPLCPGFKTCLKEIEECCRRTSQGRERVADVLSVQRQNDLLGLDCLSEADIQEVVEACTNLTWFGKLNVKEHGATNETSSVPNGTRETTWSYDLAFEGLVVASTETIFEDFSSIIDLRIAGTYAGQNLRKEVTTDSFLDCGPRISFFSNELTTAAPGDYVVEINLQPDGTYTIFILNPAGPLGFHVYTRGVPNPQYDDNRKCTGFTTRYITQTAQGRFFPPSNFLLAETVGQATNRVSGTFRSRRKIT